VDKHNQGGCGKRFPFPGKRVENVFWKVRWLSMKRGTRFISQEIINIYEKPFEESEPKER